jgi:uncharacterized membrane protein
MTRSTKLIGVLAVVAALSITANLWVLGTLMGEQAGRPRHMERGLMRQMIGSVPPEVRLPLREQLKARRSEMRDTFRDMRDARRAVSEAIAAADYSDAALAEALSALRQQTDAAQALIHAAMVDTAGDLTAEQRQAWAKRQWRKRRLPSENLANAETDPDRPASPGGE